MSDSNGQSPVIHVEGVGKTYRQGKLNVEALRGVDLDVAAGEFMALCGPSGSGKTTLLNLIGALDQPTTGRVMLEDRDLSRLDKKALSDLRRDRIGFVFQAYNLMPVLSAYENAEMVLWIQGVSEEIRRSRVMSLLADVGLEGLEDRRPNELSGGQQQRVAIARAIASNPAVVLADEPTANVDSETGELLLDLMQDLNEKHGVTFVFSTHDPMVMERARRVVRLVDGQISEDSTKTHEVRTSVKPKSP